MGNMTKLSFLIILILITVFHQTSANFQPGKQAVAKKPPPLYCTADSLLFYQDCRMCSCPRPHRIAKCYKKSCDLRTKDSGQCPTSTMRLDDSHLCPNNPTASCKVDNDCPGIQLCCFDFCTGAKCMNPVPLDSGMTVHHGRGYQ